MPSNMIVYMHCERCLEERPESQSPSEFARLEVGFNRDGDVQVWCTRHDQEVVTLDDEFYEHLDLDDCECAECGKAIK